MNAYAVLDRKSEGKRPHGRCRYRLEDNIKMNFKEVGCEDVKLHQDRVQ
jgi:hypothetical protein